MKAFRYSVQEGSSLQDIKITDEVRDLVRACRRKGTHGPLARVDFRQCGELVRADVTYRDGRERSVLSTSPVLHNALLEELRGEEERRVQYRASKGIGPSPNGDEWFAVNRSSLDADLAHHRQVK